jgi:oligoribonuclease NrnB/cAMP/cGMP phosphodiesterase (DHH superfamily)
MATSWREGTERVKLGCFDEYETVLNQNVYTVFVWINAATFNYILTNITDQEREEFLTLIINVRTRLELFDILENTLKKANEHGGKV